MAEILVGLTPWFIAVAVVFSLFYYQVFYKKTKINEEKKSSPKSE